VLEDGLLKRIELAEQHIKEAREKLAELPWNADKLELTDKIDNWQAMIVGAYMQVGSRMGLRKFKPLGQSHPKANYNIGEKKNISTPGFLISWRFSLLLSIFRKELHPV